MPELLANTTQVWYFLNTKLILTQSHSPASKDRYPNPSHERFSPGRIQFVFESLQADNRLETITKYGDGDCTW